NSYGLLFFLSCFLIDIHCKGLRNFLSIFLHCLYRSRLLVLLFLSLVFHFCLILFLLFHLGYILFYFSAPMFHLHLLVLLWSLYERECFDFPLYFHHELLGLLSFPLLQN